MAINKKKFFESLKGTLKNLGSSAGKVLENLEKQDKAMDEKMKKVLKSGETNTHSSTASSVNVYGM